MKTLFYMILAFEFLIVSDAIGQKSTIEFTFTGEYLAQYVSLDSIYIENLNQGGDTTLYAPDTVLALEVITGVLVNSDLKTDNYVLFQNRPNPFADQTNIMIIVPEPGLLKVSVINLIGKNLAFFEKTLDAGIHSFTFYAGNDNCYIFSATLDGVTKTLKMLSQKNNLSETSSLIYRGKNDLLIANKSALDINKFEYSLGDHLRFIGYAKNPSDIISSDVIEASPYGNEVYFFEILEGIPCPDFPTITYNGQTYTTVKIVNQCWLKENLNIGNMIPGGNDQTNNNQKEKYCYDDNEENCTVYGGLYQWNEMMEYQTLPGTQGICPNGWHLPTNNDFTILNAHLGWEAIAGGKMKENSTLHWSSPNSGASNDCGFTAVPGGSWDYTGNYCDLSYENSIWSSVEITSVFSKYWFLSYNNTNFSTSSSNKLNGYSVRCLKEENTITTPAIITANISNISQTSATCGGEVIDDGGAEIIARGVCWSTSPNPTIDNNHTMNGTGMGNFVSIITGLNYDTEYFIRAYATNIMGTSYGEEKNFITNFQFVQCGDMVIYEEQSYNTILIGTQCWLKENLNVGTMITSSYYQWDNGIIEKYCYNDNPGNCANYGGLYDWSEMMDYTNQPGTTGICPYGWHIPTDEDWCILVTNIDSTVDCNFYGFSGINVGYKMKSTSGWNSGGNGSNISGFTALPGGIYYPEELPFFGLGGSGIFWSSTQASSGMYVRALYSSANNVNRGTWDPVYGISVRCVRYDNVPTIPAVTTMGISNISETSATGGGNVIFNGGSAILARGVCWSTFPYPTLDDFYSSNGTGTGLFTSILTGLTANTVYYVRAYATNVLGTAYGNLENFTTQSNGGPCPGTPTVTYEGQVYNTVQIGTQCWLKENLNVGAIINGSIQQSDNNLIEKYCYNNNPINCEIYGGFYQWEEMMQYDWSEDQGICPNGWHIPSNEEWCIATMYIDPTVACVGGFSGTDVGLKMKSTSGWIGGGNGTNASEFSALPGGMCAPGGYFSSQGNRAYFWSTSLDWEGDIYDRILSYFYDNIETSLSIWNDGLNIRCVKD